MRPSSSDSLSHPVIALVGVPNAGKTTLYNWLTGSNSKTVNYPGATVDLSVGKLASHLAQGSKSELLIMDTPGTYSLQPKSSDEWVTLQALYENPKYKTLQGVVLVVDGLQLARHLLLALQLKEAGFSLVVVVTMADLLRKEGLQFDYQKLSNHLGAPVLPFEGLLAGGLSEIVGELVKLTPTVDLKKPQHWNFTQQEEKILTTERWVEEATLQKGAKNLQGATAVAARTEKIDQFLLHPVLGSFLFLTIMTLLFSSVYWLATPFMDFVDSGFAFFSQGISQTLSEGLWLDFLTDGLVASFAAFLVFVPQIFILFLAIGLLEGTGYLARAATLIDRPFSKLGMSGRSFVPLLSGFACAVPALIATRNIPSKKDRWITAFVIPLMSCSARLPVYALCLGFLFDRTESFNAGFSLALLYLLSIVLGAVAAAIVSRFIPAKEESLFFMELPLYRMPRFVMILRQSWSRTFSYIKRAGPVIFTFAVLVWLGSTFPKYDLEDDSLKLQSSYIGQLGQTIEPVFEPMGLDWRAGIGLISSFAAREVFVSSMALTYQITDEDESEVQTGLLEKMRQASFSDGRPVFTTSSIIGLMVFFLIALQCMSTVAVQIKETGSWKFALSQLVVFNIAAYILVIVLVQGLRVLGVS